MPLKRAPELQYCIPFNTNKSIKKIISHTTDVCVGADTQQLLKVRAGTIQGPRVHNPQIFIFHFDAGILPKIYVTTRTELQVQQRLVYNFNALRSSSLKKQK